MYLTSEDRAIGSVEGPAESSLLDVFDVIADRKWLVAAITVLGLLAALVYIALVPRVYEATALIQVSDGKPGGSSSSGSYMEAARLFEDHSPATAEVSMLRSGVVLGDVVDRLGLDVSAQPKYLPVIGEWLSQHPSVQSRLSAFGLGRYLHGRASIKVSKFVVPRDSEGRTFTVVLTTDGGYELRNPEGQSLLTGTIGHLADFRTASGGGELLIATAAGSPGAEFELERLPRASVIERLQRKLKVEEQGKDSGVVSIRLAGSDPEAVALTVNEVAHAYLRQNAARRTAEAQKALGFVESMLPGLRTKIEQAESRLTRFRNQYGAFDITAEGKLALDQSVQLQAKLLDLQTKRKDLGVNLFDNHPMMRALDAQIGRVTAELGSINGHIRRLPAMEQDVVGLARDLKVNSDLYLNLLNSAQQIRLARDGQIGNVRLVDAAWAPHEPVGAKPAALVVAGMSGGLVLGVLLALLRHGVRKGVEDPDWIDSRTDMTVVTTVPYSRAQKRLAKSRRRTKLTPAPVLAIREPDDPAVESLRSMRTALERKMPESGANIVVITGPTHGIGKSFAITNLATVLGATGRKVLLIDGDMRKGRLNETFQVAASPGLSELLAGKATLSDTMHREVAPNVDLITAGARTRTPSDLLSTRSTHTALTELAAAYRYVLIDTPPVLAASDAASIAQWAGAVFMVARAEVTSLRELHEAEKRLSQRGVVVDGVIYAGVDSSKRRNDIYSYGGYEYLIHH
jgi:tyrosine-protein kinase Etk/Wzc